MTKEMSCELDDFENPGDEFVGLGIGRVSRIVYQDTAKEEDAVADTLGYIEGYVEGYRSTSILLDGGSTVDLINSRYARQMDIPMIQLRGLGHVKLANDEIYSVRECARTSRSWWKASSPP